MSAEAWEREKWGIQEKKTMKVIYKLIFMLIGIASLYPLWGQAQTINPKLYYRLTTQWQGEGKSLDIVSDGQNNKIRLANTGYYSGQFWKFTPVKGHYYRLTTQWQGDGKSLDVINDGSNNKLQLADTGDFSGQYWKVTPLSDGYVRLTTQWQGKAKSLDVVNDGINNRLQLASSGDFLGQYWKLTALGPVQSKSNSGKAPSMAQRCYDLVQGKVAWAQNGSKNWQEANVHKLCTGTSNPQNTVACFKQGIARHNQWGKAIAECSGSQSSSIEQRCYQRVQGKVAWAQNGSKNWQEANVRKLCAGTSNPQNTVACFKQGIARHNQWGKAITECSGKQESH